ncbi:LPS assembly lipoprotein LptE [Singulisphaera sp. Ch08]|uniref:LPS assembly lipoprotein LptE n=1 Tax=Singulisphaera sp. Ch08 TaxID=3120278 RepID=A0AAU7C759_9BACT
MLNPIPSPTRRDILRCLALAMTGQAGCGYSVRAPYDTNVRTICVPMFRSVSFRRDIQQQLTQLVINEIQKRTPYKVVGNREDADTILEGTVNFADKNIMVENPENLPRQLTATMQVSVNWVHNPPLDYERNREPTLVSDTVYFAPELGETTTTAFYRTCQNLATQIVDMMEEPWSAGEGKD